MSDSADTPKQGQEPKANAAVAAAKPSFFKGVKTEFHKIIWPGKSEVVKRTTAVVVVSLITGALIAVIDGLVLTGLNLIMR